MIHRTRYMMFKNSTSKKMFLSIFSLSSVVYLSTTAYGESQNWQTCLDESDLSCAIDIRTKRNIKIPDNSEEVNNISKADLEMLSSTLFFEGKYPQLEIVLDALSYPENIPDEEPPLRATIEASIGLYESKSEDGSVRIRHGGGADWILIDDAIETLTYSQKAFSKIFGGIPKHPLIMDIYPTGKQFIGASGIPEKAVHTTGVIALSKWSRLLLTSPRAMASGYDWKNTAAHEYIHLVVAWRSKDKAPVWLQEGLAKYFEQEWKTELQDPHIKTTFYLSQRQQSQLAQAIKNDAFVPFEKFRYSMAYLDSTEEASLAYAQVSSMVHFLDKTAGRDIFIKLMDRLAIGEDAMEAVSKLAGYQDFEDFRKAWVKFVRTLPLVEKELSEIPISLDGIGGNFGDDPLLSQRKDLAKFVRIGDLLFEKGFVEAALVEYNKAQAGFENSKDEEVQPSPILYSRQALCYLKLQKIDLAFTTIKSGYEKFPEHPKILRVYGTILQAKKQNAEAFGFWRAAYDVDPYDVDTQKALVALYQEQGNKNKSQIHQQYIEVLRGEQMQRDNTYALWK